MWSGVMVRGHDVSVLVFCASEKHTRCYSIYIFEKLTVAQLVKKFPAPYGLLTPITVFIIAQN
jgi:hypothetical protein